MDLLQRLNQRYKNFRPFTDQEAWGLFRVAAIGEAVGWTMLIVGILFSYLPVSWHDAPVEFAGRIHGILFMIYIIAVLALSPSLGWSWLRTIVAGLCSVPPYGSLLFELAVDRERVLSDYAELSAILWFNQLLFGNWKYSV